VYECDAYSTAILAGSPLTYTANGSEVPAGGNERLGLVDYSGATERIGNGRFYLDNGFPQENFGVVDGCSGDALGAGSANTNNYRVYNNTAANAWVADQEFVEAMDDCTIHCLMRLPGGTNGTVLAWNAASSYPYCMDMSLILNPGTGATVSFSYIGEAGGNSPRYISTGAIPEIQAAAGDVFWIGVHTKRSGGDPTDVIFDYDIYYSDLSTPYAKVASGGGTQLAGRLYSFTEMATGQESTSYVRFQFGEFATINGNQQTTHVQHVAMEAGELSDARLLVLSDALALSQSDYTDPTPGCTQPAAAPAQAQTQVYTRGWL